MDFQTIVDGIPAMTCAVSVETFDDDRPGVFRIVAGTSPYVDSIEHPQPGMKSCGYVRSGVRVHGLSDKRSELCDYCYRAAVEKKCLHSYVSRPDGHVAEYGDVYPVGGRSICTTASTSWRRNMEADVSESVEHVLRHRHVGTGYLVSDFLRNE